MKDKQRKKAQRLINKHIRALNKNIQNDNLWRGSFVFRQNDANWERFEDGSGGILNVWIEARDLKTGIFWGFRIDNYGTSWHLWEHGNKFIAEYSDVWKDIDAVKNDKTDWSKVKWVPKYELFRGPVV